MLRRPIEETCGTICLIQSQKYHGSLKIFLSPNNGALLERAATWIVRRGLTAPAILFLETGKPLNFLGSQLLIAFSPFIQAVFKGEEYHKFALILEKDANVELLIELIEAHS